MLKAGTAVEGVTAWVGTDDLGSEVGDEEDAGSAGCPVSSGRDKVMVEEEEEAVEDRAGGGITPETGLVEETRLSMELPGDLGSRGGGVCIRDKGCRILGGDMSSFVPGVSNI